MLYYYLWWMHLCDEVRLLMKLLGAQRVAPNHGNQLGHLLLHLLLLVAVPIWHEVIPNWWLRLKFGRR